MKKPICAWLATLVCVTLLAAGCQSRPTALSSLGAVAGKSLLYLGTDDDAMVVVDPEEGRRYVVNREAGAVLASVPPFAAISLAENPDGTLFLQTGTALSAHAPIIAADSAKAAVEAYPPALLESLRYRANSQYALRDYAITSTRVIASDAAKTVVEVVADIKPDSDQFRPHVGSSWGRPDADGYVHACRFTIDLCGNGGMYCLGAPDGQLLGGLDSMTATGSPETKYQPATYQDTWQALEQGNEVESVIYEDDTYSFTSGLRLRPDCFESTIYRIDRATGERVALFDLPRNTVSIAPLALNGRTLYLSTTCAPPYSEGRPGPMAALSLDTGEYTVLLSGQAPVIGRVAGTLYVLRLRDGVRPGGICALDTTTGGVSDISALPGKDYDAAYDGSALQHFSDGLLYVLWPEAATGMPGPTFAIYAINPATGEIEKQSR